MDRESRAAACGQGPASAEFGTAAAPVSMLGELRHVYLLPDLPPDILASGLPAGQPHPELDARSLLAAAGRDGSWEQVFEHVRRLIADDHRSAA